MLPSASTHVPEVQSFVNILVDARMEGLYVADLKYAIVESVAPKRCGIDAMMSSPDIFRTIRKALMEAVVETSHSTLNMPRNATGC